jgi:hypothetical protein
MRILDRSLRTVRLRVANYEDRVKRLATATKWDEFEACLFEVVVAERYALHPNAKEVAFVVEDGVSRPDLHVITNGEPWFVECKKADRTTDIAACLRNDVRNLVQDAIGCIQATGISAVIELVFRVAPSGVSTGDIASAALASPRSGVPSIDARFTVLATRKTPVALPSLFLFPSPGYYLQEYGYDPSGPWHGLVNRMNCTHAGPSFLSDVEWECAIKWRIENEDLIWRQKRLAFQLLFKGLDQLKKVGHSTILHVAFERDIPLGHRHDQLAAFLRKLIEDNRSEAGAIVFNEAVITVSPQGRFDFVEHAHPITRIDGPFDSPPISGIFLGPEDIVAEDGDWGIGGQLPPIDEIYA